MGQKVLRIKSTLTFISVIFVSEHIYVFRIFTFLLSRRFLAQPSFGLQPSFSAVVFSRQSGTPVVPSEQTNE